MKRILIMGMIFLMLFSSTAMANDSVSGNYQEPEGVMAETMVVEPRFTYLLYVTIGLEIDENGHLIYGGSARAPENNLRITVHLQQSTNGLFWDEIATSIKHGYDNVGLEEEQDLVAGNYYYRAKIIADVLDANRNVIETTTAYSDADQY